MSGITFVRNPDLPFLELKQCDSLDHLSYKNIFMRSTPSVWLRREPHASGQKDSSSRLQRDRSSVFPAGPSCLSSGESLHLEIYDDIYSSRMVCRCSLRSSDPPSPFPGSSPRGSGSQCRQLILACRSLLHEDASPLEIESMLLELMHLTKVILQPSTPSRTWNVQPPPFCRSSHISIFISKSALRWIHSKRSRVSANFI